VKIYRFIPNGKEYTSIALKNGQFWPDGIDFGEVIKMDFNDDLLFGQQPDHSKFERISADLPLPDFPAYDLQLPIVSAKALEILSSDKTLENRAVPITVTGETFYALQPIMNIEKASNPLVQKQSKGLTLASGEVYFYYSRMFDVKKIHGEFFAISDFKPYSDLYLTENLLERTVSAGLTGLEYVELVYDNGPVIPRYPKVNIDTIPYTLRKEMEFTLISRRQMLYMYDWTDFQSRFQQAIADGYIPYEFMVPEYER